MQKASESGNPVFTSLIAHTTELVFHFILPFKLFAPTDKEFVQRQECGLAAVRCDENDGGYRQVDIHLVNLSVYIDIMHLLFYFVNRFSRILAKSIVFSSILGNF